MTVYSRDLHDYLTIRLRQRTDTQLIKGLRAMHYGTVGELSAKPRAELEALYRQAMGEVTHDD